MKSRLTNFEKNLAERLLDVSDWSLKESQRPWPPGMGPNRKPSKRGPGGKPIPEEEPKADPDWSKGNLNLLEAEVGVDNNRYE